MADWSRRALLTAGTAAGAVGISSLAPGSAQAIPISTLVLRGINMQLLGTDASPSVGDTLTVRGQLQQVVNGPVIGDVFITGTVLAAPDQDAVVPSSFEQHLFRIGTADTITGSGIVREDGSGSFVMTGGTGRFASVRASYTTQQSADLAGEGSARFSFVFHL
jgi:hypothetical protein